MKVPPHEIEKIKNWLEEIMEVIDNPPNVDHELDIVVGNIQLELKEAYIKYIRDLKNRLTQAE